MLDQLTLKDLLTSADTVGVVSVLIILVYCFVAGWIYPRSTVNHIRRQYEEALEEAHKETQTWNTLAFQLLQIAGVSVNLAEKAKANRESDHNGAD